MLGVPSRPINNGSTLLVCGRHFNLAGVPENPAVLGLVQTRPIDYGLINAACLGVPHAAECVRGPVEGGTSVTATDFTCEFIYKRCLNQSYKPGLPIPAIRFSGRFPLPFG